jgi:hypothetical protein
MRKKAQSCAATKRYCTISTKIGQHCVIRVNPEQVESRATMLLVGDLFQFKRDRVFRVSACERETL